MRGLEGLIERVKAATGPDRELDTAIAQHFGLGWDYGAEWPTIEVDGVKDSKPTAYQYTASIDAALALVKRALPPDANLALKQHADGKYFHVEVETDEGDFTAYNHPSLPLAIIAALLSALISKEFQS